MSSLTDSEDALRECCPDTATAAATIARLTRELAEARESLAWWTEAQPCDLRHREPFDFGQCQTHDRTFPLGGTCDHAGLSEVAWMEQREREQRVRAFRAEEDRDEARAAVEAVRALHVVEIRYHDGSGEWSCETAEEAADYAECAVERVKTFEVCEHCGRVESSNSEDWDYRESIWPCSTIRALEAPRG